jgi:flagellar basal-body rod modification protein FlgD
MGDTAKASNTFATETVSTLGSSSKKSSSSISAKGIADNFDQFLQLLTTQLKTQSPLDPLDANQFTQQLVQFAGVEQQLKTNTQLEAMMAASKASAASAALTYVGAEVTADGTTTTLSNNKAQWSLNFPSSTEDATIIIRDTDGNEIFAEEKSFAAGRHTYTWTGRTSTGAIAPAGDYSIEVNAKDANGTRMTVSTEIKGVVDSVSLEGDLPSLIIGGTTLSVDKVRTIKKLGVSS